MTSAMGRPTAYGDRQIKHRTIPMDNQRSLALGRAAAALGVSRATLITRLIDAGLVLLGEAE